MRFEFPNLLWLLLVVPPALVVFLFWAWRVKQRLLAEFIEPRLLAGLMAGVSPARRKLKLALLVGAVACLIVAAARPQWGFDWEETKQRGLDIVVAVDTSKSMLADDVAPNRLKRVQIELQDLMQLAKSDRLGLVAFAGTAFLMCPLTVDDSAFKDCLDALDVNTIPQGGTALASAIDVAQTAFRDNKDNHRILVLISDGEDHEPGAVEAARRAAADGMRIFTVGVGTPDGTVLRIPDGKGGMDYVRDPEGNAVNSRLNEPMLKEIAAAGNGQYLRLAGAKTMETLYDRWLAPLPKTEGQARLTKHYRERFFWPLLAALGLLLTEMLISERRRETASSKSAQTAPVGGLVALFLVLMLPGLVKASPASALKDYQAGRFEKAGQEYQRLLQTQTNDLRLNFDAGAAAYRATNYDAALKEFTAVLTARDVKLQQAAYYNLGNTKYRMGEAAQDLDAILQAWEQAAKYFQSAVTLDENDADAKHNLDFVQRNIAFLVQLRELARQAKAAADEATRQRHYRRALEIMEQLFQEKNPIAKKFEEFTKKLKDIDEIATPHQP